MATKDTNGKNSKEPAKPEQSPYVRELLEEQARLIADRDAVVGEFAKQIAERGEAFDEEDIKKKVKEVLPDAFAGLKSLINNSESDQVRASLIKYVFDLAILVLKKESDDKGKKMPDTVGDLVKQLEKND